LVPQKFHKWIHVFGKKASERMPMKKLWNHTIDVRCERRFCAKEEEGISIVKGKEKRSV